MTRIQWILKLQKAIRLYHSARMSGDQVSMDVAELTIEECKRKLKMKDEAKTS